MRARSVRFVILTVSVLVIILIFFNHHRHLTSRPHPWPTRGQETDRLHRPVPPPQTTRRQSQTGPAAAPSSTPKAKGKPDVNVENHGAQSNDTSVLIVHNASALVERAKEMFQQNGVVLFTVINDAFLDFAASWCCNTASFDRLHQRVLFLATDKRTARRLKSLWPNVTVAVIDRPQFTGAMEYSKAGYVRLMVERTRLLLRLLEAGVQLLLFEVDFVWLKNPLPLILARQNEGDILGTRVSDRYVTCGCFLFLNPTAATVNFWRELTRKMDDLFKWIRTYNRSAAVSEALNDQQFFSELARQKYAGIRIVYLPSDLFPDGKWYNWPEKRRHESRPFVIHNNWILGAETKRRRAKAFGHWFWDESRSKCNSSALLRLQL